MAKTGIAVRRERFLPHRFERFGLAVDVVRCMVDASYELREIDPERHLVDLSEQSFSTLALELQLRVTEAVLRAVYPPAELPQPRGRLGIVVRCARTRVRRAVWIHRGSMSAGAYDATITLSPSEIFGSAELYGCLVRDVDLAPQIDAPGYARLAGAKLADARSWEVRLERLRNPGGAFLDVRYESFADHSQRHGPRSNLYHLELDTENPVLWLNSDHRRVVEVLDSQGTVGRRARARDVVFDHVGQSVWTRLFWQAARDWSDNEEVVWEWQDAVLEQLLPRMFPEEPDQASRLYAMKEDLHDNGGALILERLEQALQQHIDLTAHIDRLLDELERD